MPKMQCDWFVGFRTRHTYLAGTTSGTYRPPVTIRVPSTVMMTPPSNLGLFFLLLLLHPCPREAQTASFPFQELSSFLPRTNKKDQKKDEKKTKRKEKKRKEKKKPCLDSQTPSAFVPPSRSSYCIVWFLCFSAPGVLSLSLSLSWLLPVPPTCLSGD
ncbi:hypothetical protein LX36DRAFT_419056 [Colletotrichum falcatum]|nr:hypothetical protein LX36DRAFT_419056 [Colletotrichum falcatum]